MRDWKKKDPESGKYVLSDFPKSASEFSARIGIRVVKGACGPIHLCKSGKLEIISWTEERISGEYNDNIIGEDEIKSNLTAKFKLPVIDR